MQKLEGMIAKPKMMENYVRKKEKKKPIANDQPNGVKTIRILGRQGDKPITREVRLKNDWHETEIVSFPWWSDELNEGNSIIIDNIDEHLRSLAKRYGDA